MHFCLAVTLTDCKVGLAQVNDAKVKDPSIRDLQRKVRFGVYRGAGVRETGENHPHVVKVKLKNGKEYSYGVLQAKGHAEVPLSWDELLEKYRECARLVLNDQDVERTIDLMGSMEKIKSIKELTDIAAGIR